MKHPAASNPTTDALPGFLDAEPDLDATPVPTSATAAEDEPAADAESSVDPAAAPAADDDAPVAGSDAAAASGGESATLPTAGGGGMLLMLGGTALVLAVLMATTLEGSNAALTLTRFGLGGSTLMLLGAVLLTGAVLQRRLARLQRGAAATVATDSGDWTRAAQESLQFLVAAQQASNERPPAAGEELQHVLMAMQRQDEKLNNLTKAIKMYGKPLMEIASQTTDLAAAVTQTRTALEARADATRAALAGLESRTDDAAARKERAELLDALHVVAADVDKLARKPAGPSIEPLQQQLGRLEIAVAALAQRLDNSEVHKSLLRLEEVTQKAREEVQQLRGDGLGKATTQLQDRLDRATKGLADGLQQLRDGNLGGLETGVREIQRELTGVATAVAQIQAAVRNGTRPVAAAAATPAATPTAPAAPAPAAASAPAAAPATATKGDDPNAGYKTGTRATSGKNVLGAIAKLKQMKN